jgi:uncharacterized tellurite resistance protein B-like protein
MGFWDIFKDHEQNKNNKYNGSIYKELQDKLPKIAEENLIKLACLAGLFSRIAYADLNYDKNELIKLEELLIEWNLVGQTELKPLIHLITDKYKELSGIENHKYCKKLNELMDNNEKHLVLQALFAIAASDESVSNLESEEIKLITDELCLPRANYLAARAEVADKLKALKK